jgi:hypothetical protein
MGRGSGEEKDEEEEEEEEEEGEESPQNCLFLLRHLQRSKKQQNIYDKVSVTIVQKERNSTPLSSNVYIAEPDSYIHL